MNTKLTLKLDEEVIERAKNYAKKQHRSLSSLVENYFKIITDTSPENETISPLVRELSGVVRLPKGTDARKEYSEYVSGKYK